MSHQSVPPRRVRCLLFFHFYHVKHRNGNLLRWLRLLDSASHLGLEIPADSGGSVTRSILWLGLYFFYQTEDLWDTHNFCRKSSSLSITRQDNTDRPSSLSNCKLRQQTMEFRQSSFYITFHCTHMIRTSISVTVVKKSDSKGIPVPPYTSMVEETSLVDHYPEVC